MPYIRHALSKRLTRRTCLHCGHQGRELQGAAGVMTIRCPKCNADLYARPPRSYAEMEGLVEVGPDPAPALWRRPEPAPRLQPPRLARTSAHWFERLSPASRAAIFLAGALACAASVFFLF